MAAPCWPEWEGFNEDQKFSIRLEQGELAVMARSRVRMFLGQTCFNQLTFFKNEMVIAHFQKGLYDMAEDCITLLQAVCCPEWLCTSSAMDLPGTSWETVNASLQGSTGTNLPLKTALHFFFFFFFLLFLHSLLCRWKDEHVWKSNKRG